jgi:ribosomal protein S17E
MNISSVKQLPERARIVAGYITRVLSSSLELEKMN